jgi:phosphoribosylamine--glycine ligase
MRILVIGGGGREHAIVWKLAQSPGATEILCAPGNAGIAMERVTASGSPVTCPAVPADDIHGLLTLAREKRPELTVVGPDNPLALGIVDLFQNNGFRIWGPNKKAAQFESSKAFSQAFMNRHGIPAPHGEVFEDAIKAKDYARGLDGACAIKADGLALGKGVIISKSTEEADQAIDEMLVKQSLGSAGKKVVIQRLLDGIEVSLHALCDGRTARLFPTAQDHKRAYDDDRGPNTGGMGAYSPAPFLSDEALEEAGAEILKPWLDGCKQEEIDFRGILYPGVMLTPIGPKVLEFNARFGDPETQVYLTRLESDLLELCNACVDGTLANHDLKWKPETSVCVVLASGGYPGNYEKGKRVSGLEEVSRMQNVKVFHAGTAAADEDRAVVSAGGRVLGVTAWAGDIRAARDLAYSAVAKIKFDGMQYRKDIAAKALRG